MRIIVPKTRQGEYTIAAKEFAKFYQKITSKKLLITTQDDGVSDLVVIGAPAVNTVLAQFVIDKKIPVPPIKAGTDEYIVKTYKIDGRRILLLAGGLGRSTLYAVYHYFETAFSCHYYWDGDVIPKKQDAYADIDILEKPRFQYRGLRYFAHRGCKRFHAEMWNFADWKREIDYLCKRRLNMFMLRIGLDDLFQKAFPDTVRYPNETTMDREIYGVGYNDRRLFWSLEYRGKLRKKVFKYAFDRGLMSPEDVGTITHWYSFTPKDFTDKENPTVFGQSLGRKEKAGLVWDIREEKNFEYYIKLTETHISEYGKPDLFHTIGFAERLFSDDRQQNFLMKRYVYDKFSQYLKERYPNSPVLIASWDFWHKYKTEEVAPQIATFDENQAVILDYTSDTANENNFTKWGIVNKFPWIFGMFQGYASDNDFRGYYTLTQERLRIAKQDEHCKGMIIWPEISHSDTLALEFFTENAWDNKVVAVEDVLERFCNGRYGKYAKRMLEIWHRFMSIVTLMHWSMAKDKLGRPIYAYHEIKGWYLDRIFDSVEMDIDGGGVLFEIDYEKAKIAVSDATYCLKELAKLPKAAFKNAFIKRDAIDIARTIVGRYAHICLISEAYALRNYRKNISDASLVYQNGEDTDKLLQLLSDILSTHKDFSLYETLRDIRKTEKVFDGFEETLKNNTVNSYCRENIYETVKEIFIPENRIAQKVLRDCIKENSFKKSALEVYKNEAERVLKAYYDKPLSVIDKEAKADFITSILEAATVIEKMPLY